MICDWCKLDFNESKIEQIFTWNLCNRCRYYLERAMSSIIAGKGVGILWQAGRPDRGHWVEFVAFVREHQVSSVLEYGPGLTTELLALEKNIKRIVSIECDPVWFGICKTVRMGEQVQLIKHDNRYSEPADLDEHFDLGLVDGPDSGRVYSIKHARRYCDLMYLHDPDTKDQLDELADMEASGEWKPYREKSMKGHGYRFWRRIR